MPTWNAYTKPVNSWPQKRVYVVDDEPAIATTLGIIFRGAGFDTSVYNNPLLVLEACDAAVPDAIVSDVAMPNMTGIDLAIRVGQLFPACRVILISGQATIPDLLQSAARNGHVFDVLLKPVSPAALVEHLHAVLS